MRFFINIFCDHSFLGPILHTLQSVWRRNGDDDDDDDDEEEEAEEEEDDKHKSNRDFKRSPMQPLFTLLCTTPP